MSKSSQAARALLSRMGFEASSIGTGKWLLRRPKVPKPVIRRIGPPRAGAHLVYHRRAARRNMGAFQLSMLRFLADEHVSWTLRELEVNCVIDVGANVGQFAKTLRANGYAGRIVSFEPLPGAAAKLRESARNDPDWLVYETALGDERGQTQINARPGTMSSLLPTSSFGHNWHSQLREGQSETIQIQRLDDLYDDVTKHLADPRVYLKMDTQGYDLQTFRGAGTKISSIIGLQSEVACVPIYAGMPRLPEQFSEYESAGFEVTGMFPVTRHKQTLRVIEYDLIMVRPAAASMGAE